MSSVMASGRFFKQGILLPMARAAYEQRFFIGIGRYLAVTREFLAYRRLAKKERADESISVRNFWPCLIEKYKPAGLTDPYFYQDTWCAKKVFSDRPAVHVDIGSALLTVGILSQFTEVIYVDIRPLRIKLPGLTFRQASLLNLPFDSDSLESVSSLSVVEHVGLGRYGDPLDPFGTDKACAEMARVVRPGGSLYVAVPTQKEASTHFNAHRIFSPDRFIAKFPDLTLVEEAYGTDAGIWGRQEYQNMGMPPAFGCFHFQK
jgi:SAM-dependent methyltransferase